MFLSQVGPRSQRVSWAHRHGAARVIRLSAPLLIHQPEAEIVRTLAHEMIHQWQYDIKKCRPTHGPEFLKIMARMNRDGLGVAIRHSLNHQVEAFTKYVWQCMNCGESYRRQRRSISPKRHRCGTCHGSLREVPVGFSEDSQMVIPPLRSGRGEHESTPPKQLIERPQQLAFEF